MPLFMDQAKDMWTRGGTAWPLADRQWTGWLRRWTKALGHRASSARGRRVVLLLILVWLVSAFDLAFTLLACGHRHFVEFNPIAASMIGNTPGLIAFKGILVGLGSLILLRFRSRLLTEIGCWSICAAYSALAALWWKYYFSSF